MRLADLDIRTAVDVERAAYQAAQRLAEQAREGQTGWS